MVRLTPDLLAGTYIISFHLGEFMINGMSKTVKTFFGYLVLYPKNILIQHKT